MDDPERQALLSEHQPQRPQELREHLSRQERLAEFLESKQLHQSVILLIFADASCVLADLFYTFLTESCLPSEEPDAPTWLHVLTYLSLTITTLFLVEIPLALYAFGPGYYDPFRSSNRQPPRRHPHAGLHLFDALIIIVTFILEIALKGRERELAGLLIILRLWRLIKLVGGIAVGAGELSEETEKKLEEARKELEETASALAEARAENDHLRRRLAAVSHAV